MYAIWCNRNQVLFETITWCLHIHDRSKRVVVSSNRQCMQVGLRWPGVVDDCGERKKERMLLSDQFLWRTASTRHQLALLTSCSNVWRLTPADRLIPKLLETIVTDVPLFCPPIHRWEIVQRRELPFPGLRNRLNRRICSIAHMHDVFTNSETSWDLMTSYVSR